ncbi:MAG: hypothetical protein Q9187_001891 [Circinaria calcarea]
MNLPAMNEEQDVELLRRQYQQLLEPDKIIIPSSVILRRPQIQAQIFETMFKDGSLSFPPPDRYKIRVLKKLLESMEEAIEDPEEDEISDDLSACLAQLMSCPQVPASTAAQQKSYVTYTVPTMLPDVSCITLFEARSLIAASGTTGLRTWEAALHLGHYLFSTKGRQLVHSKHILELGAGTGFLSILCAKHLSAKYVMATDGSEEVINDLASNLYLNGLEDSGRIGRTVLKWGQSLVNTAVDRHESPHKYDLVLGADVVSNGLQQIYDNKAILALVSTCRELFLRYPGCVAIISATVRNEETLEIFVNACSESQYLE